MAEEEKKNDSGSSRERKSYGNRRKPQSQTRANGKRRGDGRGASGGGRGHYGKPDRNTRGDGGKGARDERKRDGDGAGASRGGRKPQGGRPRSYNPDGKSRFDRPRSNDGERKGRGDGDKRNYRDERQDGFKGDRRSADGGDRRGGNGNRRGNRDNRDARQGSRNGAQRGGKRDFNGKFDNRKKGAYSGSGKPGYKKDRFDKSDDYKTKSDAVNAEQLENGVVEGAVEQEGGKKKAWTPNRPRTVKSKKDFDRERVNKLVEGQETIYRGELDPRKKDEEKPKRSNKLKVDLMEEEQGAAIGDDRYARVDESSDFRDLFETCEASPARLGALYVTRKVRKRGAYAQELIETHIDNSHMSAADRSFATLLILGVVSTWGTLDEVINRALKSPRDITPDVRDALRISTYEIVILGKAPHAAVDQGVELVKAIVPSASRLANAVLHRILAMKDDFPFGDPRTDVDALARKFAFPSWMTRKFVEDLGAQHAAALMSASNDPAPLFIAVNAIKASDEEVREVFEACGSQLTEAQAGGIAPAGCYVVSNPRVLADGRVKLLFAQGKILVSDASAQAVAACLFEDGDVGKMLEIGAGRGTKTILIQSNAMRVLGHQVALQSMDSHSFKADLLSDRAQEYGVAIDQILTGNATRLEATVGEEMYDTIFIDAPCSGLGTLRRHQEIRWRMAPEHIEELVKTQLGILKSAASHVNKGGHMVYATCTVTYEENNGVVKSFLESEEGKGFALAPIAGKSCFASQLAPNSPDAHFAAKFVRVD